MENLKTAIYVRVSTSLQADEGYSIDEQISKLKSYCDIKDWSIYDIYTDAGFTGSNMERPALTRLIKDSNDKKFNNVLVYKLDRLSRSQKDTLYLIEEVFNANGIGFVSISENFDTTTPFGKAMVGILSVFAQLEREQIKERMQLGMLGRAKAGKSMNWNNLIFGYDYNKTTGDLIIKPAEAAIVRRAQELYLSGMSIHKIVQVFNAEGHPLKKVPWRQKGVRNLLDNPHYAGYVKFKGELYQGKHEPIVSKEQYERIQEELKKRQYLNAERKNARPFQSKYMASGISFCDYCGGRLITKVDKARVDGTKNVRYECQNRRSKECDSGYYKKEWLEDIIIDELKLLQSNKIKPETREDSTIDKAAIEKELEKLEKKSKRINDLYINDQIDLDTVIAQNNDIKKEIEYFQKQLRHEKKSQHSQDKIQQLLSNKKLDTMSYEEKSDLAKTLIKRLYVSEGKVRFYFDI